ncbi:MAG TPA: sulfotransferase [Thermodesulfobacteriota bacterium]|nr:sulfotransferase [Deltaproteobacteria bacterium]HNR14234.1 sulfotransferase [Thermodesulfobacteriota bacterium]HNU70208.1 sulfotransferase [Thermodesulfobacteriota bacterium]HOC39133.1 sulfotransferase [Thermodesulfobacteriota bacterium]
MNENPSSPQTIPDVSLDETSLLAAAEERTGLSFGGNRGFLTPLRVLLASMEEEAHLSQAGRYMNYYAFVRLLANRLLFEREKSLLPLDRCRDDKRYLFIAGLPRTGTTLLHNLLSQNPHSHHIRLCDGLHPFPPPTPATWNDETEPRIEKTRKYVAAINEAAPDFPKIHFLDATGPEECQWLFAHCFVDTIFAIRMYLPSYYQWLLNQDHSASYAEYHDMLRILGKHFSFDQWVLKAPRHLLFLDALFTEFPHACIIWPHRDLAKVIPSLCSMTQAMRRGFSDQPHDQDIGAQEFTFITDMLRRAANVRSSVDPARFYDLHYQELMADPLGAAKKIYRYFDIPYSDTMEQGMIRWLQKNPQNKHGRHGYSLEQYGLTRERIRSEFAEYQEQYSIPEEP